MAESAKTPDALQCLLAVDGSGARLRDLQELEGRIQCIDCPMDAKTIGDVLLSQRVALILLQVPEGLLKAKKGPAAQAFERLSLSGLPGLLLVPAQTITQWLENVPATWEVLPVGLSDAILSKRIVWHLDNLSAVGLRRELLTQAGKPVEDLQQHISEALETAHISTFEYDLGSLALVHGARRFQHFEHTPSDLADVFSMVHSEDGPRARQIIESAARSGQPAEAEYRLRTADGSYRWVRTMGRVLGRTETHPGRMVGVSIDIDVEKRVRHILHQTQERLDVALRGAQLNAWYSDLINGEHFPGPLDEHFFGRLIRKPAELWELVHPDDLPVLQSWFDTGRIQVGPHGNVEFRARHPSGEWRWYASYCVTHDDELGRPQWLYGVTWDISERKAQEVAVADARRRLEESLLAGNFIAWEWDLKARQRRFVAGDQSVFGGFEPMEFDELISRTHPQDQNMLRQAISDALTGGEYRVRFRFSMDGAEDYHWIESRGNCVNDASGDATSLRGISFDITREVDLTEQSRQNEQRLIDALGAAGMICWEWDLGSGKRRSWGNSLQAIGLDPATMVEAQRLMHPDDAEKDRQLMEEAIANGTPYANEFRVVEPGGKVRWIYSRGSISRNEQGQAQTMQGVALDVTEKRTIEAALRNVEGALSDAVNSAGMLCWEWGVEDGLRSLFGDAQKVFGSHPRSTEEMNALIHPEDVVDDLQRFKDAVAHELPYQSEFRILHPDGSERWMHSRGSPRYDATGKIHSYFGVVWDITERHAQEDALRRNLEWLQLAVIGAGVNTWTLNLADNTRQGGVMDEEWYGFAPASIDEMHALLSAEDQERFQDALLVAVDTNELLREQIKVRRPDGREVVLEVIGRPRYDPSGMAVEVSGVSIDITEREQRQVALREALQRAEEAVAAKARFLASMSHEIRTPMNGVIGVTQLLRGTDLSPRQSELTDTLYSSADQLLGVINDILDFSKLEGGQMRLEQESFDLAVCLAEAQSQVAGQAAQKQLCLCNVWNFPQGLRLVGDAQRLRQMLLNLMSNAVKFTDAGEVRLEATYDEESDELRLQVIDTGIGIPDHVRQHLFQPFWQGDASMTRRFGGTGLGLVICRELATAMGGDINLLPSERGSIFEVRLNLPSDAARQPDRTPLDVSITLCDFPTPMRECLERQLHAWGCRTRWEERFEDIEVGSLAADEIMMTRLSTAAANPSRSRSVQQGHRMLLTQPYVMTNLEDDASNLQAVERVRYPVYPHELHVALKRLLNHEILKVAPRHEANDGAILDASIRILLAEDNEINQYLALAMLEQIGLDAACVDDGFKAVNACVGDRYDVVLMDIEMPLMNGLEASRILRSRNATRPYIIALTAHVLPESRKMMMDVGIDDVLHKPLIIDDLVQALRRAQEPRHATM